MSAWWQSFFDDEYLHLWGGRPAERERTAREIDGLWTLLGLSAGARVLDAPCGYGRVSQPLAARGAVVVGVDQSAALLAAADRDRDGIGSERLRYLHHDLREPLGEGGFDVAINLFSSLGYGNEDDDLAVLSTLRRAVRPDGRVFVETAHRDNVAVRISRGASIAERLADGTLVVEEPQFEAVTGRVATTWYWSGPRGSGQKSASLRIYCITELAALMTRAGLRVVSAHRGCSPEPFRAEAGWRVGLLAVAA
jgi:SAM-dependent methyltransferase